MVDPDGMAAEHIYELMKNGEIKKVKDTKDNYDVLYTSSQVSDAKRTLTGVNSLNEKDGLKITDQSILNQLDSSGENRLVPNTHMAISSNNEEINTLFEYVSINSDVEFNMTTFKNNSDDSSFSTLKTDHNTGRVNVEFIDNIMKNGNLSITRDRHNHPGNFNAETNWPAYPSGFNNRLQRTIGGVSGTPRGDRGVRNKLETNYPNRIPNYSEVYVPQTPFKNVLYNSKTVRR